jgi:hypothetical protein
MKKLLYNIKKGMLNGRQYVIGIKSPPAEEIKGKWTKNRIKKPLNPNLASPNPTLIGWVFQVIFSVLDLFWG